MTTARKTNRSSPMIFATNSWARVESVRETSESAATIRVLQRDSKDLVARTALTLPLRTTFVLLIALACATTGLVAWLIAGARRGNQRGVWIDAMFLTLLLSALSFDFGWPFESGWQDAAQWHKTAFVAFSIAYSAIFLTPLVLDRPLFLWTAIFVAAIFTTVAPAVALSFLLRGLGVRVHSHGHRIRLGQQLESRTDSDTEQTPMSKIQFRYGIRELMLGTLAIALLVSMGWMTLIGIVPGLFFTLLIGTAVVIGLNRTAAMVSCLACCFGSVIFGAGEFVLGSSSILLLPCLIPIPLLMLRCYEVRLLPVASDRPGNTRIEIPPERNSRCEEAALVASHA